MFFKKMKRLLNGCGRLSILLCLCFCVSNCSRKQGEPKLELSLQKLDTVAREVSLELLVTNVGEYPLVIPRLKEDKVKQYTMWGGWVYSIQRKTPDDFYGPYGYSWRIATHFKKSDLVTLKPGEHFSLTFNIAEARCLMRDEIDDQQSRPKLVDVAGEYEVKVRLGLGTDSMGESNVPLLLHWTVWQGRRESNTITFAINQEQESQNLEGDYDQAVQEE